MVVVDIQEARTRAGTLRNFVGKFMSNHAEMVNILSSFGERITTLEAAMRPIQVQVHQSKTEHDRLDATLKAVETLLARIDVTRQVKVRVREGPRSDLAGYLSTLDRLQGTVDFFKVNCHFKSAASAQSSAEQLLSEAADKLEAYFGTLLVTHSKPLKAAELYELLPPELRHEGSDWLPPGTPSSTQEGSSPLPAAHFRSADAGETLSPSLSPNLQSKHLSLSRSASGRGARPRQVAMVLPPKSGPGNSAPEGEDGGEEDGPPLAELAVALVPAGAIAQLNMVAKRMIAHGAAQQCTQMYREARGSCVETALRAIDPDSPTFHDVATANWDELSERAATWVKHIQLAVVVIFACERSLCDAVFHGTGLHRARTFAELASSGMADLVSFGEAVSRSPRAPDHLFVVLDMWNALRAVMANVDTVFSDPACIPLRDLVRSLQGQLARSACETFDEFRAAIQNERTGSPTLDGAVHPLTIHVMTSVAQLYEYEKVLEEIMMPPSGRKAQSPSHPGSGSTGSDRSSPGSHASPSSAAPRSRLGDYILGVVGLLKDTLDAKSNANKDLGFKHLFLMNNLNYVVQEIKESDKARAILGDEWVSSHQKMVQQHSRAYHIASWTEVLSCLENLEASGADSLSRGGRREVRERLKTFRMLFDELHGKQRHWSIPDAELKGSIRTAIENELIGNYSIFIRRYWDVVDKLGKAGKAAHYSADELGQMLGEFFEELPLPVSVKGS